uniref:Protein naked cuticle homolog n=1 Tax=Cavia porcellus TaxID=10141 RepID=A0A286XQB2_CAVPO
DSFAVTAFAGGRRGAEEAERRGGAEPRARDKQELLSEDAKERPFHENQGPLEVALPSEKAEGHESPGQLLIVDDGERAPAREGPREGARRRLNIDALQCDISVEEGNRQEWTFTLYDFDNSGVITREDMSSLMHTIYEVVDASMNHSSGSSKTLRVKLTVSPEPAGSQKENPASQDREPMHSRTDTELAEDPRGADKRLSAHIRRPSGDPRPCPVRGPYCVDENTERRNHYLDLAGIENYTSKFGPGSPPEQARQEHPGKAAYPQSRSRSQEPDSHVVHHRRSQVLADHATLAEPAARSLDVQPRLKGPEKPFLRSPKGTGKPPGALGSGKPGRALSYYLPATTPSQAAQDSGHHPGQPPPPPLPQSHGHRRPRQKGREGHSPLKGTHSQPAAVEHEVARDLPPGLGTEGYVVPVVQRHEHHHHHHEHHHHHHHHHFHPA